MYSNILSALTKIAPTKDGLCLIVHANIAQELAIIHTQEKPVWLVGVIEKLNLTIRRDTATGTLG
tara:strand:+ start:215 stop:409 length:195 start_codon:yes stop_codon:yes gene_type:complete